jgi:hypothetical protein
MLSTLRRIRFDWQILPLLLAAVWGLIAAYNTRPALVQFGFILLGVAVYFLLLVPDPIRAGDPGRFWPASWQPCPSPLVFTSY